MSGLYELDWLGGPTERAFRGLRPGIDDFPWGTLDPSRYPPASALARHAATQPPETAAALLTAAGELWLTAGRTDPAIEAFEEAVALSPRAPGLLGRALAGSAAARWQDHDVAGTIRWLQDDRADADAVLAHLGLDGVPTAAPRTALSFAGTLPEAWSVLAPESFASEPTGEGVRVTAFSDEATLASLPLRPTAPERGLVVELDVAHVELGSGVRVELVAGDRRPLAVGVSGHGGANRTVRFAGCHLEDLNRLGADRPIGPSGTAPERLVLRVHHLPAANATLCEVRDGTGRMLYRDRLDVVLPETDDWRLELSAYREAGSATLSMSRIALRSVTLVGFEVAAEGPAARLPEARLDRAVRHARARDPARARAEMAAVLRDGDPAELARLRHFLREDLDHVGPVVAELDRSAYQALLARSLGDAARYFLDPDIREVLTSPEIEELPLRTSSAGSLAWGRARLFEATDQPERALVELQRILDAPVTDGAEAMDDTSEAHLVSARLLWGLGRVDASRDHARAFVAGSASPDLAEKILRRHLPELGQDEASP